VVTGLKLIYSETNMNENKKMRKNVLGIHYQLSNANIWKLVSRSDVAQRMGLKSNDEGLVATIAYLEEVGYLKATDNMSDQITALCIDEVEAGYPSFPAI
jgi:hypothetical protein